MRVDDEHDGSDEYDVRSGILQGRKAWENYEHRLQKAGLPAPLNPYRHLNRSAE
jgi:hypothetical protein